MEIYETKNKIKTIVIQYYSTMFLLTLVLILLQYFLFSSLFHIFSYLFFCLIKYINSIINIFLHCQ